MPAPLLKTKLYPPTAVKAPVPRERLFSRLDGALGSRLTAVIAPAGFGKTTLVAHWTEDRGHPVSWLGLEARDDRPARFWSYVAAALEQLPGVSVPETLGILESSEPDVDALVETLATELPEPGAGGPGILVLDDLHTLEDATLLESLATFLEITPDSVRVIVTSRRDPPLPLSRWRARGQLTEVRQGDLRFSPEEVSAYLNAGLGLGLAGETLAGLTERTEGWAASLQLAALSMERISAEEHGAFVRAFAGDDRFVMDYLVDEVLARQPDDVQRVLLATSVLERMNQEVADHLLGHFRSGSEKDGGGGESVPRLRELEARGLFLVPLDRKGEWYRYHHLFGDLLRMRLRTEGAAEALRRQASLWFEGRGLIEEAIEYAFRAEDPERAAVILETRFPAMIGRGEFETIRGTVARLPPERVRNSVPLCMAMAYVDHISTRLDSAEEWLERVDVLGVAGAADPESRFERSAHVALMRGMRAEAEQLPEESLGLYTTARERFERLEDRYLVSVAHQGLAGAHFAVERLDACEAAALVAIEGGNATGNRLVSATATSRLVLCYLAQGRTGEAETLARDQLEAARALPNPVQLPVVGYLELGVANVLVARNRLDEAAEILERVLRRARPMREHSLVGFALLGRVRVALARGELDRADAAVREALALFDERKILILARGLADALWNRVLLARGRIAEASEWASTAGPATSFPTLTRIGQARVALARDEAREASDLARGAASMAEACGALAWRARATVLQALALDRLRDPQTLPTLARGMTWAAECDQPRILLDEGEPAVTLLGRLMARRGHEGAPVEFVARVLGAAEGSSRRAPPSPGGLSEREEDILRLLAEGLSNQAIAERLFVSVGTIKRHTHNIYRKLAVARRTEAVARAREIGLI
jgi:LuxR family maltose regulon positive regulatory protein